MGNTMQKYLKYDMRGKICVVTGANAGIGKETASMLAGDGALVVLACRALEKGRQAMEDIKRTFSNATVEVLQLDLGDFDSIRDFVNTFNSTHDHLDVLINNAGIFKTSYLLNPSSNHEMTLTVNHLGVFLLTSLLLPTLEKTPKLNDTKTTHHHINGPRIVIVSADAYALSGPLKLSELDNINEHSFQNIKDQLIIYGRTKLCNLLFASELNTKIKEFGSNIIINSLQPGWVHTNINRESRGGVGSLFDAFGANAAKTPQEGGLCSLFVACDPSINGKSGRYYVGPFEEGILKDFACNQKSAKELWDYSEQAVKHHVQKWF